MDSSQPNPHHNEDPPIKHAEASDIAWAIVLIFILTIVFARFLPKNDFILYYAGMAAQCVGIFMLNLKYSLKVISAADFNRGCKYGFWVGICFLAYHFFIYLAGSGKVPEDYSAFLKFSLFEKHLFLIDNIVLAPMVEEILFRGFLYRILRGRYGIFWGGTISIFLFAICHDNYASACVIGLILTIVYEESKTVWGSIISHAMNNSAYYIFHYLL